MSAPGELPPERRWSFVEDDGAWRIPAAPALWALGGLALACSAAAWWVPPFAFLAWVDLPIALLLFLGCAWIALAGKPESFARAIPGLLLALAAVLVSALHLLADRAHPWLR